MYLGYQNGKIKFYTEEMLNPSFYELDRQEYTDKEYVLDGDEYVLKDEVWEEKQAQKERERIAKLKCTKRVFALMLQEVGIDYLTMLKPLIESNPQAQLEWELCVELERSNPLLDIMAAQLMITSEHLDLIFRYANGELTEEEFRLAIRRIEEDDDNTTDTTGEPADIPVQPQDEDGLQEGQTED
jgi:hypothetical protein